MDLGSYGRFDIYKYLFNYTGTRVQFKVMGSMIKELTEMCKVNYFCITRKSLDLI